MEARLKEREEELEREREELFLACEEALRG